MSKKRFIRDWFEEHKDLLPPAEPFPTIATPFDEARHSFPDSFFATPYIKELDIFTEGGKITLLEAITAHIKLTWTESEVMRLYLNDASMRLTWNEIGDIMGISHTGARKAYLRVVNKIKSYMEEING